jgi:hypothetical protein
VGQQVSGAPNELPQYNQNYIYATSIPYNSTTISPIQDAIEEIKSRTPGTVLGQKYPNASANTKIARVPIPSSNHYKMPQPRSFGTEISGNARKKPHLTSQEHTRIIAKHEAGALLVDLATEFLRSKSTIHDTIKHYSLHQTTSNLPCSSRPPRLLSHTKKIIYRKACAASKIEYSELAKHGVVVNADRTTSKPPSRCTLY